MRKNYLMWFVILTFLIIGCRNDNFNANETSNNQQALKFRVVPKSSIPGVINELQAKTANFIVSLKASSASGKSETIFGEVKTDFVVETTNNGSIYYNFPVVPADSTPDIYNLEVKVSDGTYTSKIVRYSPSEDWLTNDPNDFLFFSGNISTYTLDGTQQTSMSMVNGSGGCSGNPGGGGGPSGPGGTNGPGNTGGGGGGNWPNTGDTGGPTGGTGGNGCGVYQLSHYTYSQNPVTGERYITGEVWINLCGETQHVFYGGSNKGNCNGVGSGTVSIPLLNDPCTKIKAKFADTKFKAKYDNINKPDVFGLDHEKGTFERYPPKNSGLQPSFVDIENKIGTTDMSLPDDKSGVSGLMHSHQDEDANGNHPIKIFSPTDVRTFINILMPQASSYTGSYMNAYSIVTTSGGNYMLQYTKATWPGSINYETKEKWQTWYKDEYRKLINDEKLTQANVEKIFTQFIKEVTKIDGLEVYKVTETSSAKLEYNGADQPVKSTPCP